MLPKFTFLIILIYFLVHVRCDGHYSIVAPANIRPNSDYHVSISLHEYSKPCDIKVSIESDSSYRNSREVSIQPYTSQLLEFHTGDLFLGQYKIIAEGLSGIVFRNESSINLLAKNASVLIQTDKAIYKPGDLIRFRVLVLDQNMKPLPGYGGISIFITDGGQNRIKQWTGARPIRGVYGDELQLSNYPVLGDWHINVEAFGETKKKKIEVAEYVLPKFEVTIDTPKHQTYKDGTIRATVRTKYTYGKAVKGEATVSVFPKTYGSFQPLIYNLITRKVSKIDGKAIFEFNIRDELHFDNEDYAQTIQIEAIVEEELTGRKQNTTTEITLHTSRYKIEASKHATEYKPGLPFVVTISVLQFDGTPVTDTSNQVIISKSRRWNDENTTSTKHTLDSKGQIHYSVIDDSKNGFSIKVSYMDAEESLGWISTANSAAGIYLQAAVKTENPKINSEVTIEVQSTDNIRYLTYHVLGRGDIIISNTVDVPNRKYHTFSFLASFAMVPKAQVLVYYILDDEVISDNIEIEFGDDLQNFVRLELSNQKTSPGQDIDITITSKPNSYVGLLGIDQSVLLLRDGNDLAKSEVFKELEMYSDKKAAASSWSRYENWEDFTNAGTVLLTNARPNERTTPTSTISPYDNEIIHGNIITTIKKTDIGPAHVLKTNTRPPLAGPYAFSRIPKPYWNRPRVHLMHDISDTWLFVNFTSGYEGRQTIHKRVPDTITSWVLTGFSLDPITGLGLTRQPKTLQVFKPFFVSIDLPYSIIRGEAFALPIVVFNYMEKNLDAEVTLHNEENEFEFIEMNNEVEKPKVELYRRKKFSVNSNDGASTSFMIKPKKVGLITVKVTARSSYAGDGVEKTLLVKPEGVPQYLNHAMLVDLRDKAKFDSNFTIDIPKNAVPDSTRIEVGAVGDILGGTVKNLDSLIRISSGCGEQNMLNFVPNIVVLNYLKVTNQLTPAIEMKAKKYMEQGYQRELTYKHDDGSFSAFGNSDSSGSTWLTAFVARSFRQAAGHIDVEEKVIDSALEWLSKVQAPNGSFPEVGRVLHSDMQGGSSQGIALTAYVLVAFLEDRAKASIYRNVINKAVDYIVRNIDGNDDLYSMALTSYALQLTDHSSKSYILQTYDSRATHQGDLKWWERPIPTADSKNIWYKQPNTVNVEMTAYGLLAMIEAGLYSDGLPVLKWLLNQRNDHGGFQSTQDTVVGLQALAKYGERISTVSNNVQIELRYNEGMQSRISVNRDNSLVLQTYELPNNARKVNVTATGNGFALLQLSYRFNTNVTGAWPRFTLDPKVNRNSHADYLHLTVCTSFVPAGDYNVSNMAVMEVTFPSGFTSDLDTLPSLEVSENVKKVETKDGDSVVVIYFDHLGRKEICPTLDAFRTHKVANQKPVPVIIYDYYDNSRRGRQFYKAPSVTLCDICEGDSCGEDCQIRASQQKAAKSIFDEEEKKNKREPSGASITNIHVLCILICSLISSVFMF